MTELSPGEKRFMKEWTYQTSGSKVMFLVMYTIGWSLIFYVFSLLSGYFFTAIRVPFIAYSINVFKALFTGLIITLLMYYYNQCRYLKIRLKQAGQDRENVS